LEYPPYVDRILATGGAVLHLGTSLAELAHLIERNEHEVYCAGVSPTPIKDYRHNLPAERARVVGEVRGAYGKVVAESVLLDFSLDVGAVNAALARLSSPVDGYDLFLLEAMAAAGVSQLLTDDGDFCCVPGIEMYTANPRVLAAARSQGRLCVR
jgi:hypothetical protein